MTKRGRGSINIPLGKNLVTTWRSIATKNGQLELKEALQVMNQDLGTNYLHHRITEWEQGKRQPGQRVINYMMNQVLPVLLSGFNISKDQINLILDDIKIISISD